MSLSIHLLPEFGWSLRDQPVFGPGSVFQGYVEFELCQALYMDRLRLVFQGQECLVPMEIRPGIIRSKRASLFAVQHTLWDSKEELGYLDAGNHRYPFTIQMPMVQYPPSMENDMYSCSFRLTAKVDSQPHTADNNSPIIQELPMVYMPFVETRLQKKPLTTTLQQSDLQLTTRLDSLGCLPGESIFGSILIQSHIKNPLSISLSLYQTITCLSFEDVPDLVRLITAKDIILSPAQRESATNTYSSSLSLDLPDLLAPTCTYSTLSTITYRLRLSVKRKGSLWAQAVKMDWPLTVGTLGAGVRLPSDISVYSTLEDDSCELPKFIKTVEYHDALPIYESARLPDYQSSSSS